jgi:uncharacterized protein YjbJ (UPF0337 family)
MTFSNFKHRVQKSVGKAKVVIGRATGNQTLVAKGRAQKAKADVKLVGDRVRHVAKDVKDAVNGWPKQSLMSWGARRSRTFRRDRRHA